MRDGLVDRAATGTGQPLRELLDAVRAGAGRNATHAATLPAGAYRSQEFFDLEMEMIFRKEWICVGHVSQLATVGDYFTVTLFGEPLVVVRGPDRVRALSSVCLHRWAPIAEGEGNAKLFSCPFHRWGYALDGRLLGAPFMERAANFDAKSCRLPEFRSEIVEPLGLIFVSLGDPVDSMSERLQRFSERYAHWQMKDLVAVRPREETDEKQPAWRENKFNWKIQVETFMECYHHIGAHVETFEVEQPARLSSCEDEKNGWTVCHSPYREDAPESAYTLGLPVVDGLAEDEHRICDYVLIYPVTLLSIRPDSIGVLNLIPVDPRLTLSRNFTLVTKAAAAQPELLKEKFAARGEFFKKAMQEDNDVNEMQQAGAEASLASVGRLSHLELTVAHLADYVRARIAAKT